MYELAVALLERPDPDHAWPLVLGHLAGECGADSGIVNTTWLAPRGVSGHAWSPAGPLPLDRACTPFMADHPLERHYLRTGDQVPRTVGEVAPDRVWRATVAYEHIWSTCRVSRELVIPLPSPPGRLRVVAVGRSGADFGTREREYARQIQPLLRTLDAHASHWAADTGDLLTPRESTVLHLLATGLTAQAIARRLRISPRTVHAHLRSLYRKLEATDRLSAVLRAREANLIR